MPTISNVGSHHVATCVRLLQRFTSCNYGGAMWLDLLHWVVSLLDCILLVASKKDCISRKGSIHSTPPHLTARPRPRVKRPKEPWPRLQALKTNKTYILQELAKACNTLKFLFAQFYVIPYTWYLIHQRGEGQIKCKQFRKRVGCTCMS